MERLEPLVAFPNTETDDVAPDTQGDDERDLDHGDQPRSLIVVSVRLRTGWRQGIRLPEQCNDADGKVGRDNVQLRDLERGTKRCRDPRKGSDM